LRRLARYPTQSPTGGIELRPLCPPAPESMTGDNKALRPSHNSQPTFPVLPAHKEVLATVLHDVATFTNAWTAKAIARH
jgi:hypothetical protein